MGPEWMGRGERWRSVKNSFAVQHTLVSNISLEYVRYHSGRVGYLRRFVSHMVYSSKDCDSKFSPKLTFLLRANVLVIIFNYPAPEHCQVFYLRAEEQIVGCGLNLV